MSDGKINYSDLPSNSNSSKSEKVEPEKVVTGKVIRVEKNWWQRFVNEIVTGDTTTIPGYIVREIIIPACKQLTFEVVTKGSEKALWRDGTPGRGTPQSNFGRVNYNQIGQAPRREPVSPASRRTQSYDDIILETRAEAENILMGLSDIISQYQVATVSDLLLMLGMPKTFQDDNWGWTTVAGGRVRPVRTGYLLELERPQPLKD